MQYRFEKIHITSPSFLPTMSLFFMHRDTPRPRRWSELSQELDHQRSQSWASLESKLQKQLEPNKNSFHSKVDRSWNIGGFLVRGGSLVLTLGFNTLAFMTWMISGYPKWGNPHVTWICLGCPRKSSKTDSLEPKKSSPLSASSPQIVDVPLGNH